VEFVKEDFPLLQAVLTIFIPIGLFNIRALFLDAGARQLD
jgi:hypothetical protein